MDKEALEKCLKRGEAFKNYSFEMGEKIFGVAGNSFFIYFTAQVKIEQVYNKYFINNIVAGEILEEEKNTL